jgi:uncharacterized membrane protein
MASRMNAQRIDDRPQERESPVRHAHAVQASHHGRASAPGYLGLPAEEEPENAGGASASENSDQESDRAPRRRPGRARAREARMRNGGGEQHQDSDAEGEDDGEQAPTRKAGAQTRPRRQTKKSAASAKRSGRTGGASTAHKASNTSRKAAPKAAKGTSSRRKGSAAPKGSGTGKPASKRAASSSAKTAAASVKSKVASAGDSAEAAARTRVRKEAVHIGGSLIKRALIAGSRRAAQALARVGSQGFDSLLENAQRLPIQQSIDVAVPPEIAWEQWMELRHLPEGVHRLSSVERDGDGLVGRIEGPRGVDWSAEVIDEREQESFAWRSTEGADSAGLATFHPLGDRLTRIELTVDVRPEGLGDAARLVLRIADRRVVEELRRFKADAELLNPDVYEELLTADGSNELADEEEGT